METSKKGNCLNFGNCPKADRKEVIELSLTEDFVCPECQQDLIEIVQKSAPWKKFLVPVIAFLVIGGLAWGVFAYINFQKNKVKNVVEIAKSVVGDSSINVVKNTLNEGVTKLLQEADLFLTNKDYDKAKQAYNAILALDPNNQHAKQSLEEIDKINLPPVQSEKVVEKSNGESGSVKSSVKIAKTLKFDYGTYKGETVNGLRDGQGVMTFAERYLISPKDLKKRYAEAGDYVSGTWVEGNIVNGKLFDKNGEQKETLLIGH